MDESKRGKVLVVDDNDKNVKILVRLLEDYEVETAFCGEEALEKIPVFDPQVILLDIMMPGLDGYDVCRKIKLDASLSHIKVFLVSGRASRDEQLVGRAAGADDYIAKPFDFDELLGKVAAVCDAQA